MNFGDKVVVSGRLDRYTLGGMRSRRKQWRLQRWNTPRQGIYIGKRTLANGLAEFSYDEPIIFRPEEYIFAALVVFNERENPVYVPFENIELVSVVEERRRNPNMVDMEITAVFKNGLTRL